MKTGIRIEAGLALALAALPLAMGQAVAQAAPNDTVKAVIAKGAVFDMMGQAYVFAAKADGSYADAEGKTAGKYRTDGAMLQTDGAMLQTDGAMPRAILLRPLQGLFDCLVTTSRPGPRTRPEGARTGQSRATPWPSRATPCPFFCAVKRLCCSSSAWEGNA